MFTPGLPIISSYQYFLFFISRLNTPRERKKERERFRVREREKEREGVGGSERETERLTHREGGFLYGYPVK